MFGIVQRGAPAKGTAPAVLLDFGGVVYRSVLELVPRWAAQLGLPEAGQRSGPFGASPDDLWQRMQRGEVTEREYWRQRAEEFGALLGHAWTTRDLFLSISQLPEGELIRPEAHELLDATKHGGVPAGLLTNDLEFFHGPEWVAKVAVLRRFDVVVDGSVTGVLKPDPQSYLQATCRLGVDIRDVVFLDDQPWNVAGAAELGATALQVDITDPAPAFRTAARALGLTASPDTSPGGPDGRPD